jgi:transcriptional regulator with XRE-family HTH domain
MVITKVSWVRQRRSAKEAMEKLREYLRSVVKVKGKKTGIPVAQIARQSGGRITDSYIFDIMSGKTKYISVEKLDALALGLGMDSVELFKITIGYKPLPDTTQDLTAILKILTDMTPKERSALLASLRKKK